MGIRYFRAQQIFVVIFFFLLILLVGFPETDGPVKAREAKPLIPESFRQLETKVIGLKFYTTGTSKAVPMSARHYSKDFIRADTHYIWWELQLDTKAKRAKPVNMFIKAVWQRPDGTEFRQSETVAIGPDIEHPCLAAGWGSSRSKTWLPGTYQVTILVDDVPVAKGKFEVFEKLLQGK
jgi:hypothetical protein